MLLRLWSRLSPFVTRDHFRDPLFFTPRNAGEVEIHRASDLDPVGREIARVLADAVLPQLNAMSTIPAVHAALQHPQHPLRPLAPSPRLTLGVLAGDPSVRVRAAEELAALREWKWDPTRPCLDKDSAEREKVRVEALLGYLESTA